MSNEWKGQTIYLVTSTTHGAGTRHRAFETIGECRTYIEEEQNEFKRIASIAEGQLIAGITHETKPIRLGRYEDGS